MDSRWENIDDEECRRFQQAVEMVGQRWSAAILLALARGASRFTEILAMVHGLSGRLLTARLKQLEQAALVERTVIPTTPVQVLYGLTDRGRELLASRRPQSLAHRLGAVAVR
ncbi:hypothetical protein GCM10023194_21370 [Planotetraspora phitsanulokensis]|uniref:HTH hxlR-type domain-containing protein n=1 Tax=Planotetraspora phitsanulokensis TaxID=575192 RepID=A0A8J3XEK2_9ACTN|nr:helix-turn-helix domain-containing protein [Planotetraspora phitsanulokensis]GII38195.1 hypothetical protein Pph01_31980 [Planotetraspora phitsanulokensis]